MKDMDTVTVRLGSDLFAFVNQKVLADMRCDNRTDVIRQALYSAAIRFYDEFPDLLPDCGSPDLIRFIEAHREKADRELERAELGALFRR